MEIENEYDTPEVVHLPPGVVEAVASLLKDYTPGTRGLRNKGIVAGRQTVGLGDLIVAKSEAYTQESGSSGIIVAGAKRKLIPHNQFKNISDKGKTHQEDEDGTQYYDSYSKPNVRRTPRRRTVQPYRKSYQKTRRLPYKKISSRPWAAGMRRVGGVPRRPYRVSRGTYGRSTYGTGRRSRPYYTRRTRRWYR